MLNRRGFAAMAVCALATPVIRPARAASRNLRLCTTLPADSHVGAPLKYFASEVAAGTGGRVTVELMWTSSIGGEVEMVQGVSSSTLDCGFVSVSPLGGLVPSVALLDMPFVFRDKPHAFAVLDGRIGTEMAAALAKQHVNILGWAENGLRHVTANRAITDVSGLAGLKIRVNGSDLMIQAFNAMGAIAGTVAWNRLYQELKAGRFEAQENSIGNIIAGRLQEVQSFVMLTAHVYSAAAIIASDDVMEDLSPADRVVVAKAAQEAGRMTRVESERRAADGMITLRAQGTTIIETVDRGSFIRALAPAEPAITAKYGTEAFERIRGLGV
ncbi:MAG: TRAP transporter substrate-binding protein [Rhodopila sp.]|jgi:tripartite ATP-independent transporter DctP family solute receptor